jgi:hypothetical protein
MTDRRRTDGEENPMPMRDLRATSEELVLRRSLVYGVFDPKVDRRSGENRVAERVLGNGQTDRRLAAALVRA